MRRKLRGAKEERVVYRSKAHLRGLGEASNEKGVTRELGGVQSTNVSKN